MEFRQNKPVTVFLLSLDSVSIRIPNTPRHTHLTTCADQVVTRLKSNHLTKCQIFVFKHMDQHNVGET